MLILTLDEDDDYVKIGDDITIYLAPYYKSTFHKKIRIKIDAPKSVNISRRQAIEKREKEQRKITE